MSEIVNIKIKKEQRLNTCVYVDYENITKQLKNYGTTPSKINFFEVIKLHLEKLNLNIIDFLVYANYDDGEFTKGKCQTELQALGLQTRHTSNKGKNSGDLEMTIDALKELYKNAFIDVFVIISCDRDFVPLIKAIKCENKIAYVISTEIGFNKVVISYADEHEYIENIFANEIKVKPITLEIAYESNKPSDQNEITFELMKKTCNLFYTSKLYESVDEVSLLGFASQASKALRLPVKKIIAIFENSNELEYIDLYVNDKKTKCLREGSKKCEIFVEKKLSNII